MLAIQNLTANFDTANTTTYSTASVTPKPFKLLLLGFQAGDTADPGPAVTVAGNGLTWTSIGTLAHSTTSTPLMRTWVYGALTGSAPTAGAITMNAFTGGTLNSCVWSVDQVSGADLSGNTVLSCLGTPVTGFTDTSGTSCTATIGAFASVNNGAYSACGVGGVNTPTAITKEATWTSLSAVTSNTPASLLGTSWIATNDTSVSWTWTTNSRAGIVAFEIKAATDGADVFNPVPFIQSINHYSPI